MGLVGKCGVGGGECVVKFDHFWEALEGAAVRLKREPWLGYRRFKEYQWQYACRSRRDQYQRRQRGEHVDRTDSYYYVRANQEPWYSSYRRNSQNSVKSL
ncbi:hypothetical protein Zmor_010313 [Zophobas morio]|uniref:Uncharacterized protein n=1 Tax=Zophobas morio TaxID=2755281 RepID=A0AA38MJJ4_9CUCU|nr:hypothetical protein Zmor_010313 [Zophobas morio]